MNVDHLLVSLAGAVIAALATTVVVLWRAFLCEKAKRASIEKEFRDYLIRSIRLLPTED